jgi:hypothetical protein
MLRCWGLPIKSILAGLALAMLEHRPTFAESYISDPGADAATAVFTEACLRTMGHVDRVTQWAQAHSLSPALANGLGGDGQTEKWVFVSGGAKIALVVNSSKQSCTVFADRAAQDGILKGFGTVANSMSALNGSSNVKVEKAKTEGQFGSVLSASFTVARNNFFDHVIGRMVAVERPGGPFQALLQVEAVDAEAGLK